MKEVYEYILDMEELPNESIDDLITFPTEARDKVPLGCEVYFCLTYSEYYCWVTLRYLRPETEDERAESARSDAAKKAYYENQDRAELARLKAKYEGIKP